VDEANALGIARSAHAGQRTRSGRPLIDHVERVAAAVPADARATALLHDVLERTPVPVERLRHDGLDGRELAALALLTRAPGESYEVYVLRLARAPGAAGRLARTVKLADLDDHLREPHTAGAPPYRWARRRVLRACRQQDGMPTPAPV
jgi:hypothetical protein